MYKSFYKSVSLRLFHLQLCLLKQSSSPPPYTRLGSHPETLAHSSWNNPMSIWKTSGNKWFPCNLGDLLNHINLKGWCGCRPHCSWHSAYVCPRPWVWSPSRIRRTASRASDQTAGLRGLSLCPVSAPHPPYSSCWSHSHPAPQTLWCSGKALKKDSQRFIINH